MELWTTLSSPLGLAVAAGIILLAYLYYSYTHCVFHTGGLACNSNLVWQ